MTRDILINSNLNPLTKSPSSSRSTEFKHLSNDHKDCLNQRKNSHNLCDEIGISCCKFDAKLKLKQHDQNFPMKGESL